MPEARLPRSPAQQCSDLETRCDDSICCEDPCWGSDGKESARSAEDLGLILGLGRDWLPTLVFLPGEFHGQRSLAGYTPWGCTESDTTERLTLTRTLTVRIK